MLDWLNYTAAIATIASFIVNLFFQRSSRSSEQISVGALMQRSETLSKTDIPEPNPLIIVESTKSRRKRERAQQLAAIQEEQRKQTERIIEEESRNDVARLGRRYGIWIGRPTGIIIFLAMHGSSIAPWLLDNPGIIVALEGIAVGGVLASGIEVGLMALKLKKEYRLTFISRYYLFGAYALSQWLVVSLIFKALG